MSFSKFNYLEIVNQPSSSSLATTTNSMNLGMLKTTENAMTGTMQIITGFQLRSPLLMNAGNGLEWMRPLRSTYTNFNGLVTHQASGNEAICSISFYWQINLGINLHLLQKFPISIILSFIQRNNFVNDNFTKFVSLFMQIKILTQVVFIDTV